VGNAGRQARPAKSPVTVLTSTFSPLLMYSGTWISMPVLSLAGFGRLVAVPPLSSGGVSTTSSVTVCDQLHVAAVQAFGDVAGVVADDLGPEQVLGVVLVIHEHVVGAVHVRERGLASRQIHFLEIIVGAQAEVVLAAAGNAVHREAEGHVAAARGRRAALDVAYLVHRVVVFDDVTAFDFGGFHGVGDPLASVEAR
jgi:hypothetical protein